MPSHVPHLRYVKRFIASAGAFNLQLNRTLLLLVVSTAEIPAFLKDVPREMPTRVDGLQALLDAFAGARADVRMTEASLLACGKVAFQSVKKLLGLVSARTELAMLLDSESYFVRPCPFVDRVLNSTTVLYARRTDNPIQAEAMATALTILDLDGRAWTGRAPLVGMVVAYQWVFRPEVARSLLDGVRLDKLASAKRVFIEPILYNFWRFNASSLLRTGGDRVSFVDVTEGLRGVRSAEHFWIHADYDRPQDHALLHRLYDDFGFFTYTVQGNAPSDAQRARNAHVVQNVTQIELMTSTPCQL